MNISILGCGWVGKALKVDLEYKNIKVYCLSKDIEYNIKNSLYNCDSLIIALPPKTKEYLTVLKNNFNNFNNINKPQIIFLSSISYYKRKELVVKGEELVKKFCQDVVILRLGGLMGYDRIAGKYSQNKIITNSNTNYIHRDDVVRIIAKIINLKIKNRVYDVVAPIQSTKEIVYMKNAKKFGLKEPKFNGKFEKNLHISSKNLSKELNYTFKKPNVLEFWE